MARQSTVWFANDGKLCETEEEAVKHDKESNIRSDVERFLDSMEPLAKGQRTRGAHWVKQWLAYNGQLTLDLDSEPTIDDSFGLDGVGDSEPVAGYNESIVGYEEK